MCQFREELVKLLLALIKLATTDIVDAEQGHDAVDNEEAVLVTDEVFSNLVEELHLMLRINGASVSNVFLSYCRQRISVTSVWQAYPSLGLHQSVLQSARSSQA
jgi:hypothetical protein